jgi:hypothetical protein
MDYIDVQSAIGLQGLRVVLTPGFPAPWSEAAKGLLFVKKLPYVAVTQELLGANEALLRWTAQATAPAVVWNDEWPRSTWIEQLYLFERLAPTPRLIPQSLAEQTLMIGLAHSICGENGYTWNRRHIMVRDYTTADHDEATREMFHKVGRKYFFSAEACRAAPGRIAEIFDALAQRLEAQKRAGSRYFIGDSLSALDIYWAAHAVTLKPLPEAVCPMPPLLRAVYTITDPVILEAAAPILLEHRDYIYKTHLRMPLDF